MMAAARGRFCWSCFSFACKPALFRDDDLAEEIRNILDVTDESLSSADLVVENTSRSCPAVVMGPFPLRLGVRRGRGFLIAVTRQVTTLDHHFVVGGIDTDEQLLDGAAEHLGEPKKRWRFR